MDDAGDVMVESVWWCDGLLPRPYQRDTEVGEGWLVLATPAAMEQVLDRYRLASRIYYLGRQYASQDREQATRTTVGLEPLYAPTP